MEVKKVGHLSEDEVKTLTAAGTLLKNLANAISEKTVDSFDIDNLKLISALISVANKVLGE